MKVHFILTSDELIYPYYLSMVSALKTQNADEFTLWAYAEPKGRYWQILKDKVKLQLVEPRDFPVLKDKPSIFIHAHSKDRLEWQVLYEQGGLFMDLDTFCVRDVVDLLDAGHEVVAGLEYESTEARDYPYNNAVVLARKGSTVMMQALFGAEWILYGQNLLWGDTGPKLFSAVVNANIEKVGVVKRGVLGGRGKEVWGNNDFLQPGQLCADARIVHFYAGQVVNRFRKLDASFIRDSDSLYAHLVKQTLFSKEWNPYGDK